MIQISKEQFERIVTAAATPTEGVYESMNVYFEDAMQRLTRELLGDAVAQELTSYPGLEDAVRKFVCLNGFYNAIPNLDLVLTETGFGVVSNQNLAPASADRVQSLRNAVLDASGVVYEDCMYLLMGTDWSDTPQAIENICSLVFSTHTLMHIGVHPQTRSKYLELRSDLLTCNDLLEQIISPELHDHLLEAIRHKTLNEKETALCMICYRYIAYIIREKKPPLPFLINRIINYLHANLESFPDYQESSIYAARNIKPYENKQEDSCYFF